MYQCFETYDYDFLKEFRQEIQIVVLIGFELFGDIALLGPFAFSGPSLVQYFGWQPFQKKNVKLVINIYMITTSNSNGLKRIHTLVAGIYAWYIKFLHFIDLVLMLRYNT